MRINKNVPNILCILRMCLIPFVLVFLIENPLVSGMALNIRVLISGIIFGIAMLTDLFDGKIARKYNYITDFGKFIDPIADKMLVLCVLAAFIECRLVSSVPVMIILAREFLITGLRLSAASKGCVIPANIWGKIKTVLEGAFLGSFYLYMFIYCTVNPSLTGFSERVEPLYLVSDIGIWVIAVFTVASAVSYFKAGRKYLKSE